MNFKQMTVIVEVMNRELIFRGHSIDVIQRSLAEREAKAGDNSIEITDPRIAEEKELLSEEIEKKKKVEDALDALISMKLF